MTVAELIAILKVLDQSLPVNVRGYQGCIVSPLIGIRKTPSGHSFILLDS